MNYAISVLQKRAGEVKTEIERLEKIDEFEMTSDIMLVEADIENLKSVLQELNTAIMTLSEKFK